MNVQITLIYVLAYAGIFLVCFYMLSIRAYEKKNNAKKEATDKTVTIIIPAYNEEKSIVRTIKSALALDYPSRKLEIIVVDDGSKDKTYELAKPFESTTGVRVRVLKKLNGGKGSALNLGIRKSKSEIIISMDADTFIDPKALKFMIAKFYNEKIMAVTSSIGVHNPKSFLQRVQHIEYYLGTFLRKAYASVGSIFITSGAFSAYRRVFFLKYGGYDENNVTEDLEIALRIQSKNYNVENAPEAIFHTIAPRTFRELLVQRRRWYSGWMKNFSKYTDLFGMKKGILGTIILPFAFLSIILSIVLTLFSVVKILLEIKKELLLFSSVNFEFNNFFEISYYLSKEFLMRIFHTLLSQPIFLIGIFSICLVIFYLFFAKKKVGFRDRLFLNSIFFILTYSILYTFWWVVAIFYIIFNKKIIWRKE